MARDTANVGESSFWPPSGPAKLMAAALLTTFAALALKLAAPDAVPPRALLIVAGLVLGGAAVWWRLRSGGPSFEERAWAALTVVAGAGVILVAREAMDGRGGPGDRGWDSLRMALRVFVFVALAGAALVLLPRAGRKVAVSLLLLVHFGGILTATTAVQPHGGVAAPWLPTAVWTLVYRYYLQFTYMNNAYHFYSPEPGPPTLLWFRVEYEDKDVPAEWLKLVNREECATRLQYQRLLALTESTNQHAPVSLHKLAALRQRREVAGLEHRLPGTGAPAPIPMSEFYDVSYQYQEPAPLTKRYIASYVRHVAHVQKSSVKPEAKVKRVRAYRLSHRIVNAAQMADMGKGSDFTPLDPIFFLVYFEGEFTPDGKLVPARGALLYYVEPRPDGTFRQVWERPQDPFLHWLLPIYRTSKTPGAQATSIKGTRVNSGLNRHVGAEVLPPED